MSVVWNEKRNTRGEVENIKLNHEDTVECDFNTTLIPNSVLHVVKQMEGQEYNVPTFGKVKVLSVLILENGNLTRIKFFVTKI